MRAALVGIANIGEIRLRIGDLASAELAAARPCLDRLGARLDAETAATELLLITGERVRS